MHDGCLSWQFRFHKNECTTCRTPNNLVRNNQITDRMSTVHSTFLDIISALVLVLISGVLLCIFWYASLVFSLFGLHPCTCFSTPSLLPTSFKTWKCLLLLFPEMIIIALMIFCKKYSSSILHSNVEILGKGFSLHANSFTKWSSKFIFSVLPMLFKTESISMSTRPSYMCQVTDQVINS